MQSRSLAPASNGVRSLWRLRLDLNESLTELRQPVLQPASSVLDTALGKAVFEFHKTQVYFSTSMQIVGVVAFHNISWLGAVTAQQLEISIAYLQLIGAMGGYTIALTLLTLHKIKGKLDWSILASSCCAMAISYGPLIKFNTAELGPDQLQYSGHDLEECGRKNPTAFCIHTSTLSIQFPDVSVGCATAPIFVAFVLCVERYGGRLKWRRRDRLLMSAVCAFAEIYALIGTIFTAVTLCELLLRTESGSWTFGQILAVAVWAPLYVDFAHSIYRESRSRYGICYSGLHASTGVYKPFTSDTTSSEDAVPSPYELHAPHADCSCKLPFT